MSQLSIPLLPLAALDWLWISLRVACWLLGLLMLAGTLASQTRFPGWYVRGWDFPRVQIALLALLAGAGSVVCATLQGGAAWYDWLFLLAMLGVAGWQTWCIHPYTRLGRREVQPATATRADPNVVHVVISNVLQQNREFDRWRDVIVRENADVVVAAEVDDEWARHIQQALGNTHPHGKIQAQDNIYGMGLWSRLPLENVEVEFIVQEDIPSIHATLVLKEGSRVLLHCLHPRPPTPQEGDSSAPRDAELVIVGKRIRQEREDGHTEPTLVVGDLNDVAWSRTTRLFQKISGLLDPRRGRGFYNTFSANSRWFRFPLDHVFVSREFRLMSLRVLDHVGSDHFPVSITLSLEPEKQGDQAKLKPDAGDHEEAGETIETQVEREQQGQEEGKLSESQEPQPR